MAEVPGDELVAELRDTVGDRLRSVIYYDIGRSNSGDVVRSHEVVHIRDDVDEAYGDGDIATVVRDLELESLGFAVQESIYTHGELRCVTRFFEGGTELHFVIDDGEGVAVAVEPGVLPEARELVEKCIDAGDLSRS